MLNVGQKNVRPFTMKTLNLIVLTHLNSVDTNICLQSVFSFVLQMAGIVLDLPALTQILQEVPLHQKLDLEPELIQASISHRVS